MNKLMIIGNLTGDPEVRSTPSGKTVCNFVVAVNRRNKVEGQPEADFFRVSAWSQLGDICGKYLTKGKKIAVVGSVSVHPFKTKEGDCRATMEVMASEVEFLSPKETDAQTGMAVVKPADNPYDPEVPY